MGTEFSPHRPLVNMGLGEGSTHPRVRVLWPEEENERRGLKGLPAKETKCLFRSALPLLNIIH